MHLWHYQASERVSRPDSQRLYQHKNKYRISLLRWKEHGKDCVDKI